MAWTIEWQEEKIGKQCIDTQCKRIRMFPVETAEGITFQSLKFLCLRIIITNDKGYTLVLTLNTVKGPQFPGFSIKHPTNQDGKTEKESYPYQSNFETRLAKLCGEQQKNTIMQLFTERFVGIATKSMKKAA